MSRHIAKHSLVLTLLSIFVFSIYVFNDFNAQADTALTSVKSELNVAKSLKVDSKQKSVDFYSGVSEDSHPPTLRMKGQIGQQADDLGVSFEERFIGPGGMKQTRDGGYLLADTVNHRIVKKDKNSKNEFIIPLDSLHVPQGLSESPNGEIHVIRRSDRSLFQDIYDKNGRLLRTLAIESDDELLRDYVGHFQTIHSRGKLYIANSLTVIRVEEDGKTVEVPGIPLNGKADLYITSKMNEDSSFEILLKDANGDTKNSFKTQGQYQSLKALHSDQSGRIFVEFEHNYESKVDGSDDSVSTFAGVIESYSDDGKFLSSHSFEKSLAVEVDRDLDIDDDGKVTLLTIGETEYEILSWQN